MTPDDPRHGTYAGYQRHRTTKTPICEPCREAKRIYSMRAGKRRSMGRYLRVTPDAAERHIRRLIAAGMAQEDIARASGVDRDTIRRLLCSDLKYLHIKTAAKIVATKPKPRDHFRPAVGTVRRICSLVAIGHPQTYLAAQLGVTKNDLHRIIHSRGDVTKATHEAVEALFRELAMKPGNDKRAMGIARKHGWAPPLAWDDIDDPNEKPQGIDMPRDGRWASHAEARTADLEMFVAADMSLEEAARQLGISRDSLWAWCDRHDARHLYERLSRPHRTTENQHTTKGAA